VRERLDLKRVEAMTPEAWKRFMRSALVDANPKS